MALSLLVAATPFSEAHAQKTDLVVLPNGDRITGTVKFLERGRLSYSTDHLQRISIDWTQITRISSIHLFDFELSNSNHLFGSIDEGPEDGQMVIVSDSIRVTVRIRDVVRIEPLYSVFWDRFTGSSIEAGVDFTKANLQRLWNLSTQLKYRTRKWLLTFDGSSYLNVQEGRESTNRNSASLTPQRFLAGGFTVYGIVKAEQNDELNLELRGTAILGASRFFISTNRYSLEGRLGLALTEEQFKGSMRTTNGEGVVSVDFSIFKFIIPKVDFRFSSFAYPSISNWGRVRGNVTSSIQWEPISDFRIGLNGFVVFDSRPAEGSATSDYGIFSSVGIVI